MEEIVLFGNSQMAEMMYSYLLHDSPYKVVAFTVDRDYLTDNELLGLPVVPFEDIEFIYPPSAYKMIIPLSFQKVNRLRAEKYKQAKSKGYRLVNYVSSRASTWPDLSMGDNCIILEHSIVCPFARLGNNVCLAGGVLIGHHVEIRDHSWVSPRAVILGGVTIEPYCFIGANATIKEGVTVARESVVGMAVAVTKNTIEKGVYVESQAHVLTKTSDELVSWMSWGNGGQQPRWGSGRRRPSSDDV